MAKIVCNNTGHIFSTTTDFKIVPLVSFDLVSVLSEALPSSEEGRAAFQITETVNATVQAQFNSPEFMKEKQYSEIIHTATIDNVLPIVSYSVESSTAFAMMNDKQKKIIHERLRLLISAVSQREAINANAELLASNTTMIEAEAKISEVTHAINRLLGKVCMVPLIAPSALHVAVDQFVERFGTPENEIDKVGLSNKLLKEYRSGVSVTG